MADGTGLVAAIKGLKEMLETLPDKKNFQKKLKEANKKSKEKSSILAKILGDNSDNNDRP